MFERWYLCSVRSQVEATVASHVVITTLCKLYLDPEMLSHLKSVQQLLSQYPTEYPTSVGMNFSLHLFSFAFTILFIIYLFIFIYIALINFLLLHFFKKNVQLLHNVTVV